MDDQEINERLAEALGYEVVEVIPYESFKEKDCSGDIWVTKPEIRGDDIFNYKSPAIFQECVTWLLGKSFGLIQAFGCYKVGDSAVCHGHYEIRDCFSSDNDLNKAIALAVIKGVESE